MFGLSKRERFNKLLEERLGAHSIPNHELSEDIKQEIVDETLSLIGVAKRHGVEMGTTFFTGEQILLDSAAEAVAVAMGFQGNTHQLTEASAGRWIKILKRHGIATDFSWEEDKP